MKEITKLSVSLIDGEIQASLTEGGWSCDVLGMEIRLNLEFPPARFQTGYEPDYLHAAAAEAARVYSGKISEVERDGPELDEDAIH